MMMLAMASIGRDKYSPKDIPTNYGKFYEGAVINARKNKRKKKKGKR